LKFSLVELIGCAQIFEDDLFVRASIENIGRADRALIYFAPERIPNPGGIIELDRARVTADLVSLTCEARHIGCEDEGKDQEGNNFIKHPYGSVKHAVIITINK